MHIGALPSLYKSHITLLRYQVFGDVVKEKFHVDIDNSAIRYYSGILFYFTFLFISFCLYKCLSFGLCVCACDYSEGYCECMRRRGQVELLLFDPELDRTLHRLHKEQREAHQRNLATMQSNEGQDQDQEQNEPQGVTMVIMVGIMHPGSLYS